MILEWMPVRIGSEIRSPSMSLTQAEVEVALRPYEDRIQKALTKGFKAFSRRLGVGANVWKRTDAAEVSDCVARTLRDEFKTDRSVLVVEKGSTLRLLFGDKVVARFKKACSKGCGANIRTKANDVFLDPSLPFPDAPTAAKVEVCWTLNATGTSYDALRVIARNGKGALWSYAIAQGAQKVLQFPLAEPAPEPRKRRSVVKLKAARVRDEGAAS